MPFDFETVDAGATAWVLASAALVLLMTPGLAFFYGGLVRSRTWSTPGAELRSPWRSWASSGWLVGYSPRLRPNEGGLDRWWASFDYAGLQNGRDSRARRQLAHHPARRPSSPFQLMFAIITVPSSPAPSPTGAKFGAFVPVRRALVASSSTRRSRTGSGRQAAGAAPARRAGLRRRHRRPHQRRRRGARGRRSCSAAGAAGRRSRCRPHNLPLVAARHGPAVVRLVRLQRRLRPRRGRARRVRVRQHQHGRHAAVLAWIVVE